MQEMGRAGRDGLKSHSTIYWNASQISANVKDMSPVMRDYCTSSDCRRSLLAKYFSYEYNNGTDAHDCCDNCVKLCCCDRCERNTCEASYCNASSRLPQQTIVNIRSEILKLFDATNVMCSSRSSCNTFGMRAELYTGLCGSLADDILHKISLFTSPNSILSEYPFISNEVAHKLSSILHKNNV